jgi:hypothetical protein
VRRRVVWWFKRQGFLDADASADMPGWKNSGFSPDARILKCMPPGANGVVYTHLCEALEPPPVSPAGGPPTERGRLVQVHHNHAVFQATETLRVDARKTQLQGGKPRVSRTPFCGPGDGGTRLTSRYTPSVIRSRGILHRLDRLGTGPTSPSLDFKTAKTTHPV